MTTLEDVAVKLAYVAAIVLLSTFIVACVAVVWCVINGAIQ